MKTFIYFAYLLFCTTVLNAVTITTDKANYLTTESVTVSFDGMQGTPTDWIGIYPSGSSYEFSNVLSFKVTDGSVSGSVILSLENVPAGNYDVRAFYNNTLQEEASLPITVAIDPNYHPVEISTDKSNYFTTENMTVSFTYMQGTSTDWIGVYPSGASYEFENVVAYETTDGSVQGTVSLDLSEVPEGNYDVRAFFNNSLKEEASIPVTVSKDPNYQPVVLTTSKNSYIKNELITVNFDHMQGTSSDWIGLYPAGASYEFSNVVAYQVTDGSVQGSVTFTDVPVGSYDVRAFFNNTLKQEASIPLNVILDPNRVKLLLNKNQFAQNELIFINYENMQGNELDWIGIYPAGTSYEFSNVVDWKNTNGTANGELSLGGLPEGNYEARAFFNNTLSQEAVIPFSVVNTPVISTIYEDAESGPSANWVHVKGNYAPLAVPTPNIPNAPDGTKTLVLVAEGGGSTQYSEYALPMNNSTDKVLEVEIGGLSNYKLPNNGRTGYIIHYAMGVDVETTNGPRRMRWYSYLNHIHVDAHIDGDVNGTAFLFYPSPVETTSGYYMPITQWNHFRVNIEKALRELEPNNKLIRINNFVATGGFFDNIKLSSH